MKDTYIVISMDVINSSDLSPNELKEHLDKKINDLNEIMINRYNLNRKFYTSRGDEIQIIMPFNNKFGLIILIALYNINIYGLKVRYGISVGKLEDDLKENSWDMNGQIFWNTRDALDDVKKSKIYDGKIKTNYETTDKVCNDILEIVNLLINKITPKQWQIIPIEISAEDKEIVLTKIGISKSSYYDRLKGSNIKEILKGFDTIYTILENRSNLK